MFPWFHFTLSFPRLLSDEIMLNSMGNLHSGGNTGWALVCVDWTDPGPTPYFQVMALCVGKHAWRMARNDSQGFVERALRDMYTQRAI